VERERCRATRAITVATLDSHERSRAATRHEPPDESSPLDPERYLPETDRTHAQIQEHHAQAASRSKPRWTPQSAD